MFLLIGISFTFVDFPGVKIALYALIILLTMSKIYVRVVHDKVSCERSFETDKLFIGLEQFITLRINNLSKLPIYPLLVTDQPGLDLSSNMHKYFTLPIRGKSSQDVKYTIRGRKRGRYKIGPMNIRVSDPLGISGYQGDVKLFDELIVFPRVLRIANPSLKSLQPYGPLRNSIPIFEDTEQLSGTRQYQTGDEVRRINWKISAKQDNLFINVYQPTISLGTAVLLNLREEDYPFRVKTEPVESGIEIAASFVRLLFQRDQDIRLATNAKRAPRPDTPSTGMIITPYVKGEVNYNRILSILAECECADGVLLPELIHEGSKQLRWGTHILLISPTLPAGTVEVLLDLRKRGHAITHIHFGPELISDNKLSRAGINSFYAETRRGVVELTRI